jgi:hypothetical protein
MQFNVFRAVYKLLPLGLIPFYLAFCKLRCSRKSVGMVWAWRAGGSVMGHFDEEAFYAPNDEKERLTVAEHDDLLREIIEEDEPEGVPVDQVLGVRRRPEQHNADDRESEPPSVPSVDSGVRIDHPQGLPSPEYTPEPVLQRSEDGGVPSDPENRAPEEGGQPTGMGQNEPLDEGQSEPADELAQEASETSMRSSSAEEEPTGDTIVVRTDSPPRSEPTSTRHSKQKEQRPGSRASRRQRRLPPEGGGIFTTMLFEDEQINVPEAREWSLFFSTFMLISKEL